eukprot:10711294-Alexandrium_andersonii.AAC.1
MPGGSSIGIPGDTAFPSTCWYLAMWPSRPFGPAQYRRPRSLPNHPGPAERVLTPWTPRVLPAPGGAHVCATPCAWP